MASLKLRRTALAGKGCPGAGIEDGEELSEDLLGPVLEVVQCGGDIGEGSVCGAADFEAALVKANGLDCFSPTTASVSPLDSSLVGRGWASRCSARSRVDGVRSGNSQIAVRLRGTATGDTDPE